MPVTALRILLLTSALGALGTLSDNKALAASDHDHWLEYYESNGSHENEYVYVGDIDEYPSEHLHWEEPGYYLYD